MSSIAPYLLPLLIWAVLYTNAAFSFKQDDILKRVHMRENSRNHPTFKVNTQNDVLLERMEDPLSAFRHGAIERRQSGQWGEWSDWSPCKPSTVYYDESFQCTIEYEIPTQRERRRECDAPSCDGDDIEIEMCTDTFTCSESNYCIIDGMDYGHVSYIFDGNCNIAYCILGGLFEESNICEGTTCPVGLPHETIPEGTMLCGSPLVLTSYAFLDNIIVEQCPVGYTCNYVLGEYTFGVCCPACEFNCVNSDECIPNAMICDGISQCGDGSDENNCDINECASDPCLNEAECSDEINAYTCICKAGYTGTNCEIEIDECASNPCFKESTCIDEINSYTCTCIPGYTGVNCETGQWGEWGNWSSCQPLTQYLDENLDCISYEIDTWSERRRECIDPVFPCDGDDYERIQCDEPFICSDFCTFNGIDYEAVSYIIGDNCDGMFCYPGQIITFEACDGTTCPTGSPLTTVPGGTVFCDVASVDPEVLPFLENTVVKQCPIGYSCTYPFDSNAGICCPGEGEVDIPCCASPEYGNCYGQEDKWYYDCKERICRQFTYSGCGGNENRFDSKKECIKHCTDDSCCLDPDPGPCKGSFPMWYFDPRDNTCKQFTYGGCDGNKNKYNTSGECESACQEFNKDIICEADRIIATISVDWLHKLLPHQNSEPGGYYLNDANCVGRGRYVGGQYYYEFTTDLDGCGTTSYEKTDDNRIVYTNVIHTEKGTEIFELECCYETEYTIVPIHIITNPCCVLVTLRGFGTFNITATLYTNDSFTTLFNENDFPLMICDGVFICFGIRVELHDPTLVLFAEECYASESEDPHAIGPHYEMISNGCRDNNTMIPYVTNDDLTLHFCWDAYDVVNRDDVEDGEEINLYIHCKVHVCKKNEAGTRCQQGCQERKRREISDLSDDGDSTSTFITHGPLKKSNNCQG